MVEMQQAAIDAALGQGSYALWAVLHEAFLEEQTRADDNLESWSSYFFLHMANCLEPDKLRAEAIAEDYVDALCRVSAGEIGARTKARVLPGILNLATELLCGVNDVLENMHYQALRILLVHFHKSNLAKEAEKALESIAQYKKDLEAAKSELKTAGIQFVGNAIVGGVCMALSGPLSFLIGGAVAVGQMVADDHLGTSTSELQTWSSRGATGSGYVAGCIKEIADIGSKKHTVAGLAGKSLYFTGLGLDLLEGYQAYGKVKAAIKSGQQAQDDLEALERKAERLETTLKGIKKTIKSLRDQLQAESNHDLAERRRKLEQAMSAASYQPKGFAARRFMSLAQVG
ncbi:MAG TPA: hypothetical protein PKD86_06610 [Gemmatales bacterium]|nr:hypothetical protein [Gemmatales bacterium]HMP59008.1 hypothetical protein [Gemmatales bacterium]